MTASASSHAAAASTSSTALSSKPSTTPDPSTRTLQRMGAVTSSEALRAEILWVMKCVDSHYSYNSCSSINRLFQAMFPDSTIAMSFACGERKASYFCTFGLAPYFAGELLKKVQTAPHYVLLFDETLNKELQEKQLDVHLRFWDKKQVTTKFYNSMYMGHATAADLFKLLSPLVTKLGHRKLLQLSMDGPNVNLALAGNQELEYCCIVLNMSLPALITNL